MGSRNPKKDVRTPDEMLADLMIEFIGDPLGYVMFNFPWDTEPSIQVVELAEGVEDFMTTEDVVRRDLYRARFPDCKYGPDLWACDFLDEVGRGVRENAFDGSVPVSPLRYATVSGHEIGKSTLVAWIIKWIVDTRPMSKGTVTAVTDEQLRTKTWAELGKWHHLSMTAHWFKHSSSRGSMSLVHQDLRYAGTWRCDARTCREEKSEAFAGQHAPTSTSFYIFDEASGVPDKVFEVREGGLSSGEPMVFDFGNGTRNSGEFFENCWGKYAERYVTRQIDSRTVAITNKEKIEEDRVAWGEDSDRFKVRWMGLFPDKGSVQLISEEVVDGAMTREMDGEEKHHRMVLGVDCARFGDDDSVIFPRRGRDARSFKPRIFNNLSTDQLVDKITQCFDEFDMLGMRPVSILVDAGYVGGAVVDFLQRRGYPAIAVDFGGRVSEPRKYRYKVDEMWGRMAEALPTLFLPVRTGFEDDVGHRLKQELTQREYGLTTKEQISLESKKELKKRGLASPDIADALALTWAIDVATLIDSSIVDGMFQAAQETNHDYDPFAEMRG
tara:strand:- start:234 stop:1895 length:1662 start_codon:yes stop_codon:yes gene_type:complete